MAASGNAVENRREPVGDTVEGTGASGSRALAGVAKVPGADDPRMVARRPDAVRETWRAASYARLSREDGADGESDSVSSQRMLIEDWAARRGDVEIVAHYADDGFSGATFDRPGFKLMIADAARGEFDTIVVKDLSRFGRSYLDCGTWIERDLPRMGVRLYSIADDFDSMEQWNYNMALLLPVKNLINEMQVITTSQKVRASLAAKRARGECVANFAPYGYVKDPSDRHRLVVDEPAARTVRRIFALRLAGASASSIARLLNDEQVAPPSLRKAELSGSCCTGFAQPGQTLWHSKTVLRILRDETYTGTLVQGKTRRASWRLHIDVPVPSDEWQRTYGTHEPIVSREVFGEVALLVRGGREDGRGGVPCNRYTVPKYVQLSCADCGAPMRRIGVSSKGREYAYYVCSAHRRDARRCSAHSVREEKLAGEVERIVRRSERAGRAGELHLVVSRAGVLSVEQDA